ncbi:hypothetical protein [uncultured Christiangramia sp.]|uniref:hypothetical protein n=1 Tax=uncultured Christiangramia sp. TaxID=503836 RepID=UPI00261EF425|nr:hypothetical protein [uncultured Christiangramia sp.]
MKKLLILMSVFLIYACSEDTNPGLLDQEVLKEKPEVVEEDIEEVSETETESDADSGDNEEDSGTEIEVELPQVWKLFKMSCSNTGECTKEGDEMDFQDTYTFREDNTVEKIRIRQNDTIKVEGTFNVTKSYYGTPAYILQYEGEPKPEDIEIYSSCLSREEYLYVIQDDENILKNTVEDCDGPRMYYSREDQ